MDEIFEKQQMLVPMFADEGGIVTPGGVDPSDPAASEKTEHYQSEAWQSPMNLNINTGSNEEVESLANYQHIASGFFAQTKEPTLTINKRKIAVNAAAARLFPDVDYMEILINSDDRRVAYLPSNEFSIRSYKWAREKDGRRYGTERTGLPFVLCICQIMGWDPDKRYKIRGRKVPSDTGENILLFDLKDGGGSENIGPNNNERSELLSRWNGTFGPLFSESERILQIDKFDGYAYFSIKNGWIDSAKDAPKDPE